jgi:hypothetical protein
VRCFTHDEKDLIRVKTSDDVRKRQTKHVRFLIKFYNIIYHTGWRAIINQVIYFY